MLTRSPFRFLVNDFCCLLLNIPLAEAPVCLWFQVRFWLFLAAVNVDLGCSANRKTSGQPAEPRPSLLSVLISAYVGLQQQRTRVVG